MRAAGVRRWARRIAIAATVLLAGPALMAACGPVRLGQDWRTADRSSAGIAPNPRTTREAVVQAYAARAFSWRGIFAVHTWIATKDADADAFQVHQVIGWRRWRQLPVVVSQRDLPDRNWYGSSPAVIAELRGAAAAAAIPKIRDAVQRYPHAEEYGLWPGPNSNTFTAWVGREVPELGLDLPVTAIGKDYLGTSRFFAPAASGSGYQLSLWGLAGITLARREGLEVNILGLVFGIDPLAPALKLPGIGRVGADHRGR